MTSWGSMFLLDQHFFVEKKYDKCKYALYHSIKDGNIPLVKYILTTIMDVDQKKVIENNIEQIVLSYLHSGYNNKKSTILLKNPLFLFEHFQAQFQLSQNLLEKISSIAVKTNNHRLLDILLHFTKIRILKNQDNQATRNRLYLNIIKSKYFEKTNYFKMYPEKQSLFNDVDDHSFVPIDYLETSTIFLIK
ncbi:hypothetical protein CYY_009156 [Polysphondylium violaceum]|uniref:Uncharacterized protein n=1 Tax=Polysphondylium violaceum TaxID=133409 RepID=A0A8J4PNA8_9MYCE|nr:hypothetical protein CYY_009156 [Polysphondylium violaceum]